MSAIIALAPEKIEAAVEQARREGAGRVQLANFNAPAQIVISGDVGAVRRAGELCLEAGAKRVIPLNVSGAWHSELMQPAVPAFAPKVEAADAESCIFTNTVEVRSTPEYFEALEKRGVSFEKAGAALSR